MKILALDLETSPNVAHVWGLWNQNVSIKQLLESTQVICFGARWLGTKPVIFRSVHHDGRQAMLEEVHRLLDEADAVMGWNSKGFDSKHLMREFLEAGMMPPSPYKELDLMLEVKRTFRFPSNKLDYVSQRLGLTGKVSHTGHEMWIKCLAGDEKAWALMRRYQKKDVDLLIELHAKLLPWLKSHPHVALHDGIEGGCTNCGSTNVQRRGTEKTQTMVYQRYQCECGKWLRGAGRLRGSELRAVS